MIRNSISQKAKRKLKMSVFLIFPLRVKRKSHRNLKATLINIQRNLKNREKTIKDRKTRSKKKKRKRDHR